MVAEIRAENAAAGEVAVVTAAGGVGAAGEMRQDKIIHQNYCNFSVL